MILSFEDVESAVAALQSTLGGNSSSSSSSHHKTPPGALPAPSAPSLPLKRTYQQQEKKEEDNDYDHPNTTDKHMVDDARAIYSIYGMSPPAKTVRRRTRGGGCYFFTGSGGLPGIIDFAAKYDHG